MSPKPKINEEILKKGGLPHFKFFDNIAELPYVEAIYLFGSRARGDFWQHSDIDLAIKYSDDDIMHRRVVKAIATEVKDTLLEVDLVDYNSKLSEEFRQGMESEKVVLYAKT
jgi:predicted nucleotidyltransferase